MPYLIETYGILKNPILASLRESQRILGDLTELANNPNWKHQLLGKRNSNSDFDGIQMALMMSINS